MARRTQSCARVDIVLSLPALCSVVSCYLQFVSLFLGTQLEFSSVGAFCWSLFFFFGVSASRVKSKRDIPFMVSFSVLPFSASLCLVGFPTCPSVVSGSRQCGCHVCFIEECMALSTAYSAQLWNRESFSLTINSCSTLGCISHALALSFFGMVAIAVSSCYCLRGWRLW